MLTDEEIRLGWLLLLDREPEGPHIYELHRKHADLQALRRVLMKSAEFRKKYMSEIRAVGQFRLATHPVNSAEATPEQLEAMFARIQAEWTKLGESEPYWSVLTNERYKTKSIEENSSEFFETGKRNVDVVSAALARHRLDWQRDGVCLELGCGVGRVTAQLAKMHSKVHGYDISPGNLRLAKENLLQFGFDNAEFHLIQNISDYDNLISFDFFYSIIVLQHNPPPVQRHILKKIVEKSNKGAILHFQIPVYSPKYSFDPEVYLSKKAVPIEMHMFSQADVIDVLTDGGCRVLEMMEDNATGGQNILSVTFLAQKRA